MVLLAPGLRRFPVLLALICLCVTLMAQDRDPNAGDLWRRARDKRQSDHDRLDALAELVGGELAEVQRVADYASKEGTNRYRDLVKERDRLEKAFVGAAERVMRQRLDGDGASWVEKLRATVLENARQADLAKGTITGSSDPARADLRHRIVVRAADVLSAEGELGGQFAAFEEAVLMAMLWRDQYEEAQELLLADPKYAKRARRNKQPGDPFELRTSLQVEMDWIARLATPMTVRDRKVLGGNRATLAEIDPQEAEGIRATNDLRILLGLSALRFDQRLGLAARVHSQDMVEHRFFAHDSPVPGREDPWKRAAQQKTSASAENIAAGQSTGTGAVEAWWHSPGHHKNMLSAGHVRIGLGRHEKHWTQLFGG